MPFGLTNAPATFKFHINSVLFAFTSAGVMVYLDDVLVFAETLKKLPSRLRLVLL